MNNNKTLMCYCGEILKPTNRNEFICPNCLRQFKLTELKKETPLTNFTEVTPLDKE